MNPNSRLWSKGVKVYDDGAVDSKRPMLPLDRERYRSGVRAKPVLIAVDDGSSYKPSYPVRYTTPS